MIPYCHQVRAHPRLGPLVASCLAAVAYAPPRSVHQRDLDRGSVGKGPRQSWLGSDSLMTGSASSVHAHHSYRKSDVAAWVSKTWARHMAQMSPVQLLQWLLCLLIGIALVGMVFFTDEAA